MCSYFTHFEDTKEQEMAQARQIRLQGVRDPGICRRSEDGATELLMREVAPAFDGAHRQRAA
jgi:hypothetical protein